MKKIKLFFTAMVWMLVALAASAQNIAVTGKVVDQAGEAIVGANVVLQDSRTVYTLTDASGAFKLNVPSKGILIVSSLGYESQNVSVNGRQNITVVLNEDSQLLDETIVVAFGTATRESFTGSATVVNAEKLEKTQVSTVTNALAGKVAGVQLISSNGAPGSSSTMRIRGISSISAGNDPLIIVDGAPFGGDISNINPADVESMTVLKDAASNALYGARGANGVIMITTKSAKRGEALVTFDAKVGVNTRALVDYDVITNPRMYYELQYAALNNYYQNSLGLSALDANARINANIASGNSGGLGYDIWTVPEGQKLFGTNGKINPNASLGKKVTYNGEEYFVTPDNWSDIAYRNGLRQEYNLSVSGASGKATVFASLGYLNNKGITENSDHERLSARLRATYDAKSWLKIGANMAYTKFNFNSLGNNGSSSSTGNIWAFTSQMAPIYPAYIRNGDGSIKVDANGFQMMDYGSGLNAGFGRPFIGDANPIMDVKLNTRNSEGNSLSANAYADFIILPFLKLTINGTTYLDETRTNYVYNPYYGQFDSTGGTVSMEHDRYITYNLQQLLNYNQTFGDHTVGALLGHEYYNAKSYATWGSKSKMFSQDNKELSGAVVDGQNAGSSLSEYNNEGFFGRLQYDYKSKVFASASYRRDASSRFHPKYRWGSFWSVGAAWIMSKEDWFKAPFVDELKLKLSYGSQGNDNIGSYRYTDLYDIINSAGNVATQFSTKGSKSISWETQGNLNTGVEFSFFGSRLGGSLDYFYRKTTNMLFSFPVAPSMGYSSYYANVGDMRNKGIELDLYGNIINTKNVRWDVNVNFTWVDNKILKLDPEKKTTTVYDRNGNKYEGYASGSTFIAEGISLNSWYLKEFAGVDPETGESLWYKSIIEKDEAGNDVWKGVETTKTYAEANYYVNGEKGMAPFYGGFGTTVEFYGFDFSINFSYQFGAKTYDSTYAAFMNTPTDSWTGYHMHQDVLKAWTATAKNTDIPRWQYNDTYSAASSTRFLISNRYLNIENINFGYTFPQKWTKKIGMSALRLYVAADNVGYISARKGLDSRQGYGSSNATTYSPMRTVSGGITVKF